MTFQQLKEQQSIEVNEDSQSYDTFLNKQSQYNNHNNTNKVSRYSDYYNNENDNKQSISLFSIADKIKHLFSMNKNKNNNSNYFYSYNSKINTIVNNNIEQNRMPDFFMLNELHRNDNTNNNNNNNKSNNNNVSVEDDQEELVFAA